MMNNDLAVRSFATSNLAERDLEVPITREIYLRPGLSRQCQKRKGSHSQPRVTLQHDEFPG